MRSIAIVLLASLVLSQGFAQPFEVGLQPPKERTYLREYVGGCVGLGAGAACGLAAAVGIGFAATSATDNGWTGLGYAFATTLATGLVLPACAAYGVHKVVENSDDERSPVGAYIGSYAALPIGIGIGLLGYWASHRDNNYRPGIMVPAAVLGALTIPAGAAVGYNWHYDRSAGPYGTRLKGRLGMPLVMLDRVEREDRTCEYGVRVQLASVGF